MGIEKTLHDLIEDNDTSIKELAEKLGVNRRQITRWISNESEMGISKLKAICEHYQVSADYLLGLPRGLNWPREEKR